MKKYTDFFFEYLAPILLFICFIIMAVEKEFLGSFFCFVSIVYATAWRMEIKRRKAIGDLQGMLEEMEELSKDMSRSAHQIEENYESRRPARRD